MALVTASKTKTIYSKASSTYGYKIKAEFAENSTNQGNNSSSVTVKGSFITNANIKWSTSHNSTLEIWWYDGNANRGGKKVASTTFAGVANSKTYSCSGTINVTHNSNGSLTGCYAKVVFKKGSTTSAYAPPDSNVSTDSKTLTAIPRQSSVGNCTAGSTLSGPTINITKAVSSYKDNITLTYNNKTITRNSFTSSKLTFTEAERLLIFQAQGAGQTKSWTISGKTYNGSTQVGSNYSGSVNITTEALATVSGASDFNVGVNPTYSTSNDLSATCRVYAYLGDYGGTQLYDSSTFTGTKTNFTASVDANSIYAYNTTSKDGNIYWRIESYINGTLVGTVNNRTCKYYFVKSDCAPTISSFMYAVNDKASKDLLGATGTYYSYDVGTELNKMIEGKSTMALSFTASSSNSASMSRFEVSIPGKSTVIVDASGGSSGDNITRSTTTGVLLVNGSITVTAYDTRGFDASLSFQYTLNPYFDPTFESITMSRNPMSAVDPMADHYVTLSGKINIPNYIANNIVSDATNSITYMVAVAGGSYGNTQESLDSYFTISGNTMTITSHVLAYNFDPEYQYSVKMYVKHYFGNVTQSGYQTIPTSSPLISRRSRKVGINRVPQLATFEVGGNIYATTSIEAGSYVKSGTNVEVGTYINFPTSYGSNLSSCTLRFMRSDISGYDMLIVSNGDVMFYDVSHDKTYHLLPFELAEEWNERVVN